MVVQGLGYIHGASTAMTRCVILMLTAFCGCTHVNVYVENLEIDGRIYEELIYKRGIENYSNGNSGNSRAGSMGN